jgi:hypothetical protein
VYLSVITPAGEWRRNVVAPGTADQIRARVVPIAVHLLREALADQR